MAKDQFEQYFAEKLWESIPSIYRHEDGLADEPGVLRAIVQVIAKQAAILRRSQDSLWDDQFIELCNEWAVPYIGDLLATRLLSEENKRGRRIDVAKTIYYRRRKGTPRILEELISDISKWEGKLVEQFQKLARSRHGLDPKPKDLVGNYASTYPGGWADIRDKCSSDLAGGPFDTFYYTPDVRQHNGLYGRYGIPKLAFYLYRLKAYEAINITPFALGDGVCFSFDPSGRDIPLFGKSSSSPNWNEWHSQTEAELVAPIACCLLGHARYRITDAIISQLMDLPVSPLSEPAADELRKIEGLMFKNERSLLDIISTFSNSTEILSPGILESLLSLSLTDDCGKSMLLPDKQTVLSNPTDYNSIIVGYEATTNLVFTSEKVSAANLSSWPIALAKELAIDPEKGRFMFRDTVPIGHDIFIAYHYGFPGPIGAGTYDRCSLDESIPDSIVSGSGAINATDLENSGITLIDDSKTYGPIASKLAIVDMLIQSANNERPYLRLDSNWVLSTGTQKNSKLTLDGLWIGAEGNLNAELILRGDYETVNIRHCSLDPGGSMNIKSEKLYPLKLVIEGRVEHLCIESSILGPITLRNRGYIEELSVFDSIIQSFNPAVNAININTGKGKILRTTILGRVNMHRLYASETLITDLVNVTDTQNGCFRFSAASALSRLPHPFESFLFENDSKHWFSSRRFGDTGYAQLSDTAPCSLKKGAENGSEIGAWSSLLNPIKFSDLKTKIDEYMPFGLVPIYINKT